MKTFIATYGNGTQRLFDAFTKNEASELAYSYGIRHSCGACLSVKLY